MICLLFILHSCFSGTWKEDIQKYISPDQLPQAYGGTRCEPDPYCTDYVSCDLTLATVAKSNNLYQ